MLRKLIRVDLHISELGILPLKTVNVDQVCDFIETQEIEVKFSYVISSFSLYIFNEL